MTEISSTEEAATLPVVYFPESALTEEPQCFVDHTEDEVSTEETDEVHSAGSVSSVETFKFPSLPQADSPSSEYPPQSLESSRSSLSASTSTSTSASTSLDTPSTSSCLITSSTSSLTSSMLSVPSILRTSSSFTIPVRGTVVFAPLPMVESRRRQSTIALGVAARSRILRHRRLLREQGFNPDEVPMPVWSDDVQVVEDPEQDARRRHHHHHRHPDVEEDPFGAEDAFASIGKFVKGAGRSFWRRVSHKHHRKSAGNPAEKDDKPPSPQQKSPAPAHDALPPDVQADESETPRESKDEEGDVWEEVVDAGSWRKETASSTSTMPADKIADHAGERMSTIASSVEVPRAPSTTQVR